MVKVFNSILLIIQQRVPRGQQGPLAGCGMSPPIFPLCRRRRRETKRTSIVTNGKRFVLLHKQTLKKRELLISSSFTLSAGEPLNEK